MEERDIPQAIDIDNEAFPTQWPRPTYASYKNELKNKLARYIVLTTPNDCGEIINHRPTAAKPSWISRFFHRSPPAEVRLPPSSIEYVIGLSGVWIMVDEAHITTIGLRNKYRRQGLGEYLFIETIKLAQQMNANIITLEARVSNYSAQMLYRKYGMKEVGMRHRYYTDNDEDAVIMTSDNIKSMQFASRFQELQNEHRLRRQELYSL
jgi:ribosomal-protein-alanine N-acetyltransferase